MNQDKELQQFEKRVKELGQKSFQQGRYMYTGFLSLAEQEIVHNTVLSFQNKDWQLFGGASDSERKMLRFGSPDTVGYEEAFPIQCLCAAPVAEKFADELTHRDYLGALMNLGIDRSTIGDILIQGKKAYLFTTEKMSAYIKEEFHKVKHTNITCYETEYTEEVLQKEPVEAALTVASERADCVAAQVFRFSRTKSQDLFKADRVFVNGRLCENSSYQLKEKDSVTVRGYGKFIYYGRKRETKKGKLSISVGIFC